MSSEINQDQGLFTQTIEKIEGQSFTLARRALKRGREIAAKTNRPLDPSHVIQAILEGGSLYDGPIKHLNDKGFDLDAVTSAIEETPVASGIYVTEAMQKVLKEIGKKPGKKLGTELPPKISVINTLIPAIMANPGDALGLIIQRRAA